MRRSELQSNFQAMSHAVNPSREAVLSALDAVRDPMSGWGLAKSGHVTGLTIEGGRVSFVIEVAASDAVAYAPVREAAERALLAVPGVDKAQVVLTAPAKAAGGGHRSAKVAADPRADPSAMPPAERLAGVARVIAVASGKGGVGKSTVAVNLACAFARLGLKTGLLDADIYGPSVPRMMGSSQMPTFLDGKLEPVFAWDLALMSIGFLVEENRAMPWRGPMASSALRQMIGDVRWDSRGPLDLLIVDLPPGTGDVHLTLVQKLSVDGVVIVSTPSEVALIDARRAAAMFGKINPPVPILGVVENMSFFPDPATGAPLPIFGHGGAQTEAARLGVPFLGEIPIVMALRAGGDEGRPLVATDPDGPVAALFLDMARQLT
jgi:ATP-binding protein involved in chromosome partitioning